MVVSAPAADPRLHPLALQELRGLFQTPQAPVAMLQTHPSWFHHQGPRSA